MGLVTRAQLGLREYKTSSNIAHDAATLRSTCEGGSSHRCITATWYRVRPRANLQRQISADSMWKRILISYTVPVQHSQTGMPGHSPRHPKMSLLPSRYPTV